MMVLMRHSRFDKKQETENLVQPCKSYMFYRLFENVQIVMVFTGYPSTGRPEWAQTHDNIKDPLRTARETIISQLQYSNVFLMISEHVKKHCFNGSARQGGTIIGQNTLEY